MTRQPKSVSREGTCPECHVSTDGIDRVKHSEAHWSDNHPLDPRFPGHALARVRRAILQGEDFPVDLAGNPVAEAEWRTHVGEDPRPPREVV